MKRLSACLTAILFCPSAFAIGPTIDGPSTGLWLNPNESGRGYDIDIQGDTMVVTTYIYTANGDPIWYLSSGTYNHATGFFQSSFDSYSGGQCFGCPPGAPDLHSGAGGALTISFHDDQSATLTYPGGSTNIVKFNYGFADALDVLYGEWAFTFNIAGLIGGDWVIFDSPYVGTDGTVYASGHMDGNSNDLALATYDASLGYVVLVAVGSFDDFYQINLDDRRGFGSAWVEPAGGTISGNGSPATGSRLLFHSEITGAAAEPESGGQMDRSQFVRLSQGPTNATTMARITKIRQALAEKRMGR